MGDSDGTETPGDVRHTLEGVGMVRKKKEYRCFIEAVCPICGKEFFPTLDWVYNTGKYSHGTLKRVCSYKCHLKAREKPKGKRELAREQMDIRDHEIYMMFRAGFGYADLASKYDLCEHRIRIIIAEQESLDSKIITAK